MTKILPSTVIKVKRWFRLLTNIKHKYLDDNGTDMKEKEKVIIWGIGQSYHNYKTVIENRFDVIAYTDIKFKKDIAMPLKGILPININKYNYDKVLITACQHYDAIKIQLTKYGVPAEKIIGLDIFREYPDETERLKEIIHDMETYSRLNKNVKFSINTNHLKIITEDKYKPAGTPSSHYFAQDIWGGRKIYKDNPSEHFDIGSKLEGFIAHLLVFREVNYIDIRPLPFDIPNLHFIQGDATTLEQFEDNSIESLSSFHAIEHFGLGRYGDKIDPDAYKMVIENIQRVIKKGGKVYIGVPVGPEDRLIFNAHRIFSIKTILKLFSKMELEDIAIIKDSNTYAETISECEYDSIDEYCCGLFEFKKK